MNAGGKSWILTIVCPDTVGIVAAVSGYLAERDYFIETSSHYGDPETQRFFMRTRFAASGAESTGQRFADEFAAFAVPFKVDAFGAGGGKAGLDREIGQLGGREGGENLGAEVETLAGTDDGVAHAADEIFALLASSSSLSVDVAANHESIATYSSGLSQRQQCG